MSTTDWLYIVAIVVLIGFSGFLAMSETALTRMSRVKAMALEDEGKRGGATLVRLTEHPERWLNPVLLVLLTCQLVTATLVGFIAGRFGPWGVVIALAFEVCVIFVIAEAAPKTWAIQHAERAALLAGRPVGALVRFWPLRVLSRGLIGLANVIIPGKGLKEGPFISEEELLAMADVAEQEEVIEREERALIHSIIEFGDTVVREVLVPRPDMVTVAAGTSVSDVLEIAMAAGYSRIPAYEQNIDDIVGIVYVKDLFRARDGSADRPVREFMRPPHFAPESKRVSELMREMQAEKFHMAIVVDEYGGTAGLATLEDLIEELVGEIVDEFDVEEPNIEPMAGGDVRVNGRMPIDEVNELTHADFPEGDWDTVAGFVYNLLGHVPTEGETVDYNGHRLRAEKVQGRRIGRVRISRLASAEPRSNERG
ncbi:MAG: HlyC/CorC family transporter [Acidimicrobiia bacterium]|nr:HlyC/CorC family transporter [Acidimicrobiia bacterium]